MIDTRGVYILTAFIAYLANQLWSAVSEALTDRFACEDRLEVCTRGYSHRMAACPVACALDPAPPRVPVSTYIIVLPAVGRTGCPL
jgi:hypothetical protein